MIILGKMMRNYIINFLKKYVYKIMCLQIMNKNHNILKKFLKLIMQKNIIYIQKIFCSISTKMKVNF
jgi:transposase